jgi:hypothetical protein
MAIYISTNFSAFYWTGRLITVFTTYTLFVFILSQINQGHALLFYLFHIYFNIIPHLFPCFQNQSFSRDVSPLKSFMYIHFPTRTICLANHILLVLTTRLIIFREEYRSLSLSKAPSVCSCLISETEFHTHIVTIIIMGILYILVSLFLDSKREYKRL